MAQQVPLFTALATLGFETIGAACFGVWKNYAVNIRMESGAYWADFAVRPAKTDRALQKALQSSLKAAGVSRSGVNLAYGRGKAVSFYLRLDRKTPYERQFPVFADACVRALRENGLAPADTCAVCGCSLPESLCFVGTYQPVHASCMRSSLEKTREKAEDNQANGSYLTGLVGALIGMLVGLIPNVLTAAFLDRISALLFALVPLAAMWCYRKFNGKTSKGSIGIIIVVSLVGVLVMQYFNLAIYIMQEYGYAFGESLSLTGELFRDGEIFGEIMKNSAMNFFFMALGILFAWRYLNQTNSGSVANMEAALGTLRPNPAFTPDGGSES